MPFPPNTEIIIEEGINLIEFNALDPATYMGLIYDNEDFMWIGWAFGTLDNIVTDPNQNASLFDEIAVILFLSTCGVFYVIFKLVKDNYSKIDRLLKIIEGLKEEFTNSLNPYIQSYELSFLQSVISCSLQITLLL